ncbi:hypothetical protein XAP6164_2770018 [Xanthomonas phaseoli pv. phaseoli]|nr:hypothetical protein XAP6164_2770018 [Xanthomonas phaseoli pv. phaseoli]
MGLHPDPLQRRRPVYGFFQAEVAMRGGAMLLLLTLAVYGSASGSEARAALPRADSVDVPRFMGDWYVIAHIPTRPERKAYGNPPAH